MSKHHPVAATLAAAVALSVPAGTLPAAAQPSLSEAAATSVSVAASASNALPKPKVRGIDVSHWQGSINWSKVRTSGVQFAYIKATEGVSFRDKRFNDNYRGATKAKVIRGAYHFARPGTSTAKRQADYFVNRGGGWSADNRTLPGMLDIEVNPKKGANPCYGLSKTAMVRWIRDFVNQYHKRTGRWAVIYTNRNFWTTCTGSSSAFRKNHPLMVARFGVDKPGTIPGWGTHTIWQYTETGRVRGITGDVDLDSFNGSRSRLLALANNTR